MTQNLIGHVGHIDCQKKSILDTFLLLGLMGTIERPGDCILVGCDPARPDDETVAGIISRNLCEEEFPFYLHERPRPGKHICYDESGPWPPVPVDDVPHYYTKESQERLAKAAAKRQRKNLKRLKDAGMV